MLEIGQFPAQGVALRACVGQRRPVLALDPLEQREALLHLLQPGRRCIDAIAIAPHEVREILELRLDAVAGVQVRLEPGIDGGELADAFPHGPESRKHRRIAFVQRGVAFRTESLNPLGAREHLPARTGARRPLRGHRAPAT